MTHENHIAPSRYNGMPANPEDVAALAANPLTGKYGAHANIRWERNRYGWTGNLGDGSFVEFGDAYLDGEFPGIKELGKRCSSQLRSLAKTGLLAADLPFRVTSNTTGIGYGITVRLGDRSRHGDNQALWEAARRITLPHQQYTRIENRLHQDTYEYSNFRLDYALPRI